MPAVKSIGRSAAVDGWLRAGYTLLAEKGSRGLKITHICRQAGGSLGSFYWHFDDLGGYRTALIDSWSDFFEDHRRTMMGFGHLAPRERLDAMVTELLSSDYWVLERAMREWARSDDAAAANIRAADRALLREVAKAFREHGFSREEARTRAELTFAAGIGLLHLARTADQAAEAVQRQPFLDLVLAGVQSSSAS